MQKKSAILHIIGYAFPCIAVWCVYLIAFYPGIMSFDSLSQWDQLTNFAKATYGFTNAHPVAHTLFMWLITRLWYSPAAVAVFQIIALACTVGYGLYILEKSGYKKYILWLASFVIAIFPANSMLVIHLWKDVLYSICLLLLTLILFRVYQTDGEWLNEKLHLTALCAILLFTSLFRQNGIVPYIGTILVLLIFYRKKYKQVLSIALISIVLMLIIRGPLYSAVGAAPMAKGYSYSFMAHQIAAVVVNNGNISQEELATINKIMPLNLWKNNFRKYTHDGLMLSGYPYIDKLGQYGSDVTKLYFELLPKNPKIMLSDWLNLTNLVWSPLQPKDGYTYTVNYGIIDNDPAQLKAKLHLISYESNLKDTLAKLISYTSYSSWRVILWRHAMYFYSALILLALTLKRKGLRLSIIAAPMVFNVASLLISMIAQDFRYIYGTILIFPFMLLIALEKLFKVSPGVCDKNICLKP